MKSDPKILITGGSGSLGSELKKIFPDAICPDHKELDVSNKNQVHRFLEEACVSIIIHAAALTSVRKCEEDKSLAWNTNVEGTRNLVSFLKNANKKVRFVYISTACVFHGDESMYTEESIPYPVNFYSVTKLVGENIVRNISDSLIIRTNFVAKKRWPYPRAFTDRFGTYLFAGNVAHGINELLREELTGTIHVVGDKVLSMYELAKMTTKDIQPMTIQDYSGPHLTMNMTLDTIRWKKYRIH